MAGRGLRWGACGGGGVPVIEWAETVEQLRLELGLLRMPGRISS